MSRSFSFVSVMLLKDKVTDIHVYVYWFVITLIDFFRGGVCERVRLNNA